MWEIALPTPSRIDAPDGGAMVFAAPPTGNTRPRGTE